MSQDSRPQNPFASPSPVQHPGGYSTHLEPIVPDYPAVSPGQQYIEAFNYQFQSPNWMMNLVWGAIAILSGMAIPIVGPLIYSGYQFRVVYSLIRSNGTQFPDFTFDDLEDYFLRGLWGTLAAIVPAMIVGPVIVMTSFASFAFVGMLQAGKGEGQDEIAVAFLIGTMVFLGLIWFTTMLLLSLFSAPLLLRAGLGKDLGRAFNFGWCFDFVCKMWLEMFLAVCFITCVSFVLLPLGILSCFVGLYLVSPVLSFLTSHFWYQWYRLYLERGGEPILMSVKGSGVPPISPSTGPAVGMPQANPFGNPPKPKNW